jgi:HAD superfamily hydrolase (TIGR01457 family)
MTKFDDVKCFILDLDGTIYRGDKKIEGVDEFFQAIKGHGIDYVFLTNDSSKDSTRIKKKLDTLDCFIDEDKILTSGAATVLYIKNIKPNGKVYMVGTPSLEEEFLNNDLKIVDDIEEIPDFVVVGLDKTLTFNKVCKACHYLFKGAKYIATHPDMTCPIENGERIPDIGAILKMIEITTGLYPLVVGKPEKYVVDVLLKEYNLKKEDIVIVGDRLTTDIKAGINSGIKTILVLSGDTDEELYNKSNIKADYVYKSLKEIAQDIL